MPQLSATFTAAARACEKERKPLRPSFGQDDGEPAKAHALASELRRVIETIDAELGSIEPYNQCMKTHGIEFGDWAEDSEGSPAVYMYLTGIMPVPPLPNEKPSAEWTRYLTKEAQVLDADTSCRRSKQNLGLAQLADPLARFESKHAKDLTEVDGQWAQIVERAKAAGFRP